MTLNGRLDLVARAALEAAGSPTRTLLVRALHAHEPGITLAEIDAAVAHAFRLAAEPAEPTKPDWRQAPYRIQTATPKKLTRLTKTDQKNLRARINELLDREPNITAAEACEEIKPAMGYSFFRQRYFAPIQRARRAHPTPRQPPVPNTMQPTKQQVQVPAIAVVGKTPVTPIPTTPADYGIRLDSGLGHLHATPSAGGGLELTIRLVGVSADNAWRLAETIRPYLFPGGGR